MTAPLADAAARKAIRDDLAATLVVEAAAGTGKTTEMIARIIAVIRTGASRLEQIVAVTFTEKAAGEMKLRLRTELERARQAAAGDERDRLQSALAELEVTRIGSIHSFCADLLRERPIEARIDPLFEVAAEGEAERIYNEAFDRWLQVTLDAPSDGVRRMLRRKEPTEALRRAGWALVDRRDFTGEWRRDPFDRDGAIDLVLRDLAAFAALGERAEDPRDRLGQLCTKLDRWIAELGRRESVRPRDYDGLEAELAEIKKWWDWKLNGGRSQYFGKGLLRADVVAQRDLVRAALEALLRAADADLAARLHGELRPLIDAYERHKARTGQLDFLDLLARARDLLRDDPRVRSEMQQRYTHFFVDEFQDTDPLQVDILLLLCSDNPACSRPSDVTVRPGKLFVVGDPKQAIYRFRRADISLYEGVKRRLLADGAQLLYLTTSFRSVPAIQTAINAAFEPVMRGEGQAMYVPLEPAREDSTTQPAVIALPVPAPYGKWNVSNLAIEESYPDAVAAFVDHLVTSSGWQVTERGGDARVPVAPRHICLMFRRFQSYGRDLTRAYVRALEARGIPHVLMGGRSFHEREEILAARNALGAIEWPGDEMSVYATLKGPFFAFHDEDIIAFKQAHGRLHPLGWLNSERIAALGAPSETSANSNLGAATANVIASRGEFAAAPDGTSANSNLSPRGDTSANPAAPRGEFAAAPDETSGNSNLAPGAAAPDRNSANSNLGAATANAIAPRGEFAAAPGETSANSNLAPGAAAPDRTSANSNLGAGIANAIAPRGKFAAAPDETSANSNLALGGAAPPDGTSANSNLAPGGAASPDGRSPNSNLGAATANAIAPRGEFAAAPDETSANSNLAPGAAAPDRNSANSNLGTATANVIASRGEFAAAPDGTSAHSNLSPRGDASADAIAAPREFAAAPDGESANSHLAPGDAAAPDGNSANSNLGPATANAIATRGEFAAAPDGTSANSNLAPGGAAPPDGNSANSNLGAATANAIAPRGEFAAAPDETSANSNLALGGAAPPDGTSANSNLAPGGAAAPDGNSANSNLGATANAIASRGEFAAAPDGTSANSNLAPGGAAAPDGTSANSNLGAGTAHAIAPRGEFAAAPDGTSANSNLGAATANAIAAPGESAVAPDGTSANSKLGAATANAIAARAESAAAPDGTSAHSNIAEREPRVASASAKLAPRGPARGTLGITASGLPAEPSGTESPAIAIAQALAILGELHTRRNRRPIADTLARLLAATRAHAGLAVWPAGEQALANLFRVMDLARKFEAGGATSFRAFVSRLESDADRGRQPDAPVVEDGTEGVRIMTVHAAKGLEFPVVVLCDPTAPMSSDRPSHYIDTDRNVWLESLAGSVPSELREHELEVLKHDREEGERLAYVAVTRARDLLVVPVVGDEERDNWLAALTPVVFPDPLRKRKPRAAPNCPAFGDDSVVERALKTDRMPTDSVAPGLHQPRAGTHTVVWWDPKTLDLTKEPGGGLRRREILQADEADGRVIASAGEAAHATWQARRSDALARGERPSIVVRTVTAAAHLLAARPADQRAASTTSLRANHGEPAASSVAPSSARASSTSGPAASPPASASSTGNTGGPAASASSTGNTGGPAASSPASASSTGNTGGPAASSPASASSTGTTGGPAASASSTGSTRIAAKHGEPAASSAAPSSTRPSRTGTGVPAASSTASASTTGTTDGASASSTDTTGGPAASSPASASTTGTTDGASPSSTDNTRQPAASASSTENTDGSAASASSAGNTRNAGDVTAKRAPTLAELALTALFGSPTEPTAATLTDTATALLAVSLETVPGKRAGRPRGKRFGTLVHAMLASVQFRGDAAHVQRVGANHARLVGATPEERDAAIIAVRNALAHPLMLRAAAAEDRGALRREVPVVVGTAAGMVEGVVDLAFVDEVDGVDGWTVIDFKTDAEIDFRRPVYEAQVREYATAITAATNAPSRAVLLIV